MSTQFVFGQQVLWSSPLSRYWTSLGRGISAPDKFWSAVSPYASINAKPVTAAREGLVIGHRTLSNGHMDFVGDHYAYRAVEWFPAYLIAFDMIHKPVLVLPENVWAPLTDESEIVL